MAPCRGLRWLTPLGSPSELTETIFGLDSFDQESILSEDGEEQDEVGLVESKIVLQ
jgi:hypothetical protein